MVTSRALTTFSFITVWWSVLSLDFSYIHSARGAKISDGAANYHWALQAAKTTELIASGEGKESIDFYQSKIQTAEFFFDRLLPRASSHRSSALSSTRTVMQLDKEHFAFT